MPAKKSGPIEAFESGDEGFNAFLKGQAALPDGEPAWRSIVDHIGRLVIVKGRFEESYAIYQDGSGFSAVRFEDPMAVLDPNIDYGMDYVWDGHLIAEEVGSVADAFGFVLEDIAEPRFDAPSP